MASDLPDGFTVDQSSGELPQGFTADSLPQGFTVDQPQQAPEISAPQPQSIMARMAADYQQRQQNIQDYQNQYQQGKIGALPAEIGKIGQAGALAFSDPITGLMNAGAEDLYNRATPERKQQIQNIGNTVIGGMKDLGTTEHHLIDRYGAQDALNNAEQYYNQSPNLKAVSEGLGNIAGAIPGASTISRFGENTVKAAIESAANKRNFYQDIPDEALKSEFPKTSSEQKFEDAKNLYGQSSAKGMTFDQAQMGDLKSKLNSLAPSPDTLAGKSWEKSTAATHVNDINDVLDSGQLSFNDVLDRRSDINSDIKAAFMDGRDKDATKLLKVKDALTAAMLTNDAPEWQMANHTFSQAASMEPLEDLALKASTKIQPANSLDTYINNLLLDDNKTAGLRPNEIEALKGVVNNDSVDDIKKQLASGFSKYALGALASKFGMVGKAGGYILGSMGSKLAKDSAFADKLKKLDMVYEAINGRELNTPKAAPTGSRALVPAGPLVNHMTDEQIAHARARLNATGGAGGGNPMYSGAPIAPAPMKFLPSPENMGVLPAAGLSPEEIARAQRIMNAKGGMGGGNPAYAGAPIAPQVNPLGTVTDPLQGAPTDPDMMHGLEEWPPQAEAYDYPGMKKKPPKKSGGAVKGKIGFKLKKSKK